jgi:hypothetical protein
LTTDHLRQITKLVWPFPKAVIETAPKGSASYVAHSIVEQRFIDVLGHAPDTELVEVVRGWLPAEAGTGKTDDSARKRYGKPELADCVVGVVLRMRCTIDGTVHEVTEVGDCGDPNNWPHDGARLKDAFSDAYKRCAMRLGVGLHLWVKQPQKKFTVHRKLIAEDDAARGVDQAPIEGMDDEVPDVEPVEQHPAAHDADEGGPSSPSDEVPGTDHPAPEPEGSQVDWPALVRETPKVTQADALRLAQECADKVGINRPTSLRRIPKELDAAVTEALFALSAERAA